jgi:hypothetical protein
MLSAEEFAQCLDELVSEGHVIRLDETGHSPMHALPGDPVKRAKARDCLGAVFNTIRTTAVNEPVTIKALEECGHKTQMARCAVEILTGLGLVKLTRNGTIIHAQWDPSQASALVTVAWSMAEAEQLEREIAALDEQIEAELHGSIASPHASQ